MAMQGEDTDKNDEEGLKLAEKWLNTVQTLPLIHWATIIAGGTLLGTNSVTGVRRFVGSWGQSSVGQGLEGSILTLGIGDLIDAIGGSGSSLNIMKQTANVLNAVADELKDPNIEGIPIHAESESVSRDVEVNKQIVIVQDGNSAQKDIVVDNAVPQLRQWQLRGYVVAPPIGIETFLVIKPTLMLQRKMLDWYAASRKPVWFKTHDNEFHKVLISHIDFAYDVRSLNALLVNVTLTEFKVMKIGGVKASILSAIFKGRS